MRDVQGDTKKTVITKNRITSKILFRLTQNFSYIRSSLFSRHLQSFKSVLQKVFVSLALKNVLQMSSPALQAHLDPAGKVLDDSPAFLPWDRSYCCCDCCLQVRDSLGVVAIHPVLKAVIPKRCAAARYRAARTLLPCREATVLHGSKY